MIGQIINYRYEVLEKIGDGDVFSVYKARDKVLNRLVALKSIRLENTGFTAAVRAGYQNVAALDHPFIARVLEADVTSEQSFVACEYVRGINVKDRVSRAGAMQVPLALDIIVPVLEALEYAHANRVVHGDLRSSDVIVSTDGEVKVTDFGLASALRACPEIADKLGTRSVHYEAPEIAEGAAPSVSSDLYSVGVILYEMLTGSLPFEGPTAVAVALKQAKETPVAPRALNTAVPKSLSDLVMRAIDRVADERFPNASSMLADVRSIRDALRVGKPISVPQPSVSARLEPEEERENEGLLGRSAYLWLTGAFVLVVVLAGMLTVYFNTRDTKIVVPNILGMTVEEATEKAQDANLTLEQDDSGEIYSNDYDEGTIAFQFPGANAKIPRDKAVLKYKVSKGPSTKRVPDLIGRLETDAYQTLQDAGFTIGKVTTEYNDKIPVTAVIKQDPEKDAMASPDSPINLVLSLGPKPESRDESVQDDTGSLDARERNFTVSVRVPSNADAQQEVRIVVDDDRGETVVVQEYHDAGDQFEQDVTAYGDRVRIRVYVGGHVVSDKSYK